MELNVKQVREALPLKKAYDTPAGIDIAPVAIIKESDGVVYCGTGWSLEIPDGYYIELVPRSSMHKYGFTLVNSVGIIDSDYRGEIIIAIQPTSIRAAQMVLKNPDDVHTPIMMMANDILNMYMVQMIVHKKIPVTLTEVTTLTETKRGDGGFGSSGA